MNKTKKTILIVDDSALNREMLLQMLQDDYDILQAENGEEALAVIEEHFDRLSLVLLDMVMPVMDGATVLKVMRARMWLNQLPVICISANASGEMVARVFAMGAAEYFPRPFDALVLKSRVSNTIALYDKSGGDLKDAIEILSRFYYRITKVNLTTDNYLVLQDSENAEPGLFDHNPSFSARLKGFAWGKQVLEEDRDSYLEFCDFDWLRRQFRSGKTQVSVQYRRNVNGEYRWTSMKVCRSIEYTDENQIVVFYVRDVNDDYLKRLDVVMQRNTDSLGLVTLNITRGACIAAYGISEKMKVNSTERIEEHLAAICADALEENERRQIMEQFSKLNLLRRFEAGETVVSGWVTILNKKDKDYYRLGLTVEMVRNYMTGDVEGILRYTNDTAVYMAERMTKLLYQHNFDKLLVIACEQRKMHIESPGDLSSGMFKRQNTSYDRYIREEARSRVAAKDRDLFLQNTRLEELERRLDENGRYSFSVRMLDPQGRVRLKNFSFVYLDERHKIVLGASEDVTEISEKDVLTGGYNRMGFLRRAGELLKPEDHPEQYALLYFNILDFKAINTLFGLETGDRILKAIHRALGASALRPLVTARMESDHFVCLLRRATLDFAVLEQLCRQRFTKGHVTISVYQQCGVVMLDKGRASVEKLIARAEAAVESIKDVYTTPYCVYDDSLRTDFVSKAQLEQAFEKAIAQREFLVYYQPIVKADTGEVVSAEALIRWDHPERGLLSPGLFVPRLEEKGRVSQLDRYVAEEIFRLLCTQAKLGKRNVPVSLNLSWIDFYDERFISWLIERLDDCRRQGIRTRIEITETSYMAISQDKKQLVNELRARGAELLMDDFGSGYSSFSVLQNYSFDILKIDMSLIRQITTNAKTRCILCSLIKMAHELGMRLVAEGVETEEQLAFLRECGCDYIQGYYFYKPMPEDEFLKLID